MFKEEILKYYEKEIEVIKTLDFDEIDRTVQAIKNAYERKANIYVFGNGGSGATASHFVCDFNKGISDSLEKKFNLICLNDNAITLMAIANDFSYEDIFVYQLKGRLRPEDMIIAISGSGNSANIVKAAEYAKSIGCEVVGLTGFTGGKLMELADYNMHAHISDMQIAEDIHMSFDHMMFRVLTDALKSV